MERDGHIWEPAKQFLKEDIEQLDENATVNIVLFHQSTASPIRFKAKDFNWNKIEPICDKMFKDARYTGICNAWDIGLNYIERNRNNYLYLFTDGLENVHPQKTDAVCQRIRNWCNQAPNNYAFFVALGEEMKRKPEVQKLINATKTCDRAFFVDNKHPAPFGAFDKTIFNVNCHSLRELSTGFSDYGTFDASIECQDQYYSVKLKDGQIKDGKATFILTENRQPSSNRQIKFRVKANTENLNICNPDIYVNIDTRDLANLNLAQPSGETEGQYDAGEAETYSSFLFWEGKDFDKIQTDLGALFNNQAKKRNASLNVSLDIPSELKNKCKLSYNGKSIGTSFEIKASDTNSILTLDIPHSLAEKEHIIKMRGKAKGLETINAEENLSYISSIYFEHDVCWHPMKVFLTWLSAILIATFLLWVFCFKPIFYPRFGTIQKTFNVPGMAPLIIRFKGARMVVLAASHPKKQSGWNRFWTGKIVYKTHPAFVSPIIFKPSRGRRVLARVQTRTYQVMPNPIPGIGAATIIDINKNIKINVN